VTIELNLFSAVFNHYLVMTRSYLQPWLMSKSFKVCVCLRKLVLIFFLFRHEVKTEDARLAGSPVKFLLQRSEYAFVPREISVFLNTSKKSLR